VLPHWKVPEEFPAAVCVPVSTPSTPLGTLWVFSETRRGFDGRETNILEIVAGRIAAELEREMLLVEGVTAKQLSAEVARVAQRQQQRLPSFAPQLNDWDLAAWHTPDSVNEFYDWGVLCDGRPYIALGDAEGSTLEAALTSTALHAALKAQLGQSHTTRQILNRTNETMWTGSAGDQFGSLWYAILEEEGGAFEFAFAGDVQAFVVGERGLRTLTRPAALLGQSPDTVFPAQQARLLRDEMLVVVSGGAFGMCDSEGEVLRKERITSGLRALTAASAQEVVDRVRSVILTQARGEAFATGTVLVAKRPF
jgi:serine phosphatase RsbU (regulator of sigma subunit)